MNRIILSALLTAISLFACAAPAVKTTSLVPAKFHEAAMLKEIAVLPFDGMGGKEFAAEIEATLASVNIDDKQYFTLIDRTKLEKILNEQALSQTGAIDETTAAKVGKLVGAKGIYTGVVKAGNAKDSPYREDRQQCLQKEIKFDKKGNAYEGNCIRWNKYTVACTKRDAAFAFTPKLIDVQTGRIIYSNNLVGAETSSACQDSGKPLMSEFQMIGMAKEKAKSTFKRDVAPNYVTITVKIMHSKEGITSKEAAQKFDLALDFARKNRLDRACELWGEARILSPDSASLIYNLGVCAEVRGDLESSLDLYKKADRALNKPDDRITAAMVRVSEAIKKQKGLAEQLGTVSPADPSKSIPQQRIPKATTPKQEAASPTPGIFSPKEAQAAVVPPPVQPKVEAKPAVLEKTPVTYLLTNSACNVRSEPDVKSKVISTLKKGDKVEKLDQVGNWCNVKLLSGQKGWIHKDLVKEAE